MALFIVLLWFNSGQQIAHEESGFFFAHPERWVYQSFYDWLGAESTGFGNPQVLPTLPFQSTMQLISSLGINDVAREELTVMFLLSMSGISMYLLTKYLITDETRRIAGLVAGFSYMLSPYALYIWHRFDSAIFFVPFLPLIALLYIMGLNREKHIWRNAFLVNLGLLLPLAAFVNPAYFAAYVLVVFSIFCFFLVKNNKDKKAFIHGLKFTLATSLIGVLLYSWWLLPLMSNLSVSYLKSTSLIAPLPTLLSISSSYLNPSTVFRGFEGITLGWASAESNPLMTTLGFSIPILAFAAMLLRRKDKIVIFFSLLAILGLFLCAGSEPPTGSLFLTLFKILPLSGSFRNPYDKFGLILVFSYSFLVGASIGFILKRLQNRTKRRFFAIFLGLGLIFVVVAPTAFPMLSGSVFKIEPGMNADPVKGTSYYVSVPESYKEADNWLSAQSGSFNVISFPISPHDYLAYNWTYGYAGINPWNLWGKPMLIDQTWDSSIDSITERLNGFVSQTDQFWKIMAILNAKYALVHRDFRYTPAWDPTYPSSYDQDIVNPLIPDFGNSTPLMYQKAQVPDYTAAVQILIPQDNWTTAKIPEHKVELDETTTIDGQPSLKITSLMAGNENWEGGVECTWAAPENLSAFGFLGVWLNFNSLGNVSRAYLELQDVNGNFEKWEITNQLGTSWKQVEVPLNSSSLWQSSANIDLSSVKELTITIQKTIGPMVPCVWWINNVDAVPAKTVEQALPISDWKEAQVPSHVITSDSSMSVCNDSSIKIVSDMIEPENWEGGVEYDWGTPKDLSQCQFISFWINFESLNSVTRAYVKMTDSAGNYEKWEITNQITTSWIRIAIPLNGTAQIQTPHELNMSSIKSITITIEKTLGQMEPTTWWLDDFEAEPAMFSQQLHISKSETFGDLDFFQIDDNFLPQLVHVTNQFKFTTDEKTMFNDLETTSIDPRNETLFLLCQLSQSDIQVINSSDVCGQPLPNITFKEINPTLYNVYVENASDPFFLTFSTTFDTNWIASYDNSNYLQLWPSQSISDQYHFQGNGFANVWYINKTGNYTITLQYRIQQFFYVGISVSAFTVIVCTVYLNKNRILPKRALSRPKFTTNHGKKNITR